MICRGGSTVGRGSPPGLSTWCGAAARSVRSSAPAPNRRSISAPALACCSRAHPRAGLGVCRPCMSEAFDGRLGLFEGCSDVLGDLGGEDSGRGHVFEVSVASSRSQDSRSSRSPSWIMVTEKPQSTRRVCYRDRAVTSWEGPGYGCLDSNGNSRVSLKSMGDRSTGTNPSAN